MSNGRFRVVWFGEDSKGLAYGPEQVGFAASLNAAKGLALAALSVGDKQLVAVGICDLSRLGTEVARYRRFPPGRSRPEGVDCHTTRDDDMKKGKGARLAKTGQGGSRRVY